MKIKSFCIPESTSKTFGLSEMNAETNKNIVFIVGKNGSGKTRLLNLIDWLVPQAISEGKIQELKNNITNNEKNISRWELEIASLQNSNLGGDIHQRQQYIKNARADMLEQMRQIDIQCIKYESWSQGIRPIKFVPKELNLRTTAALPKTQIEQSSKQVENLGVDGAQNNIVPRIYSVTDAFIRTDIKHITMTTEERDLFTDSYNRLKFLLKELLNEDLVINSSGDPSIYGRSLNEVSSMISDGQKI